jgi:hypothetical protein
MNTVKCFGCDKVMGIRGKEPAEEFKPLHHLQRVCSNGSCNGCESFWIDYKNICNGCFGNEKHRQHMVKNGWACKDW